MVPRLSLIVTSRTVTPVAPSWIRTALLPLSPSPPGGDGFGTQPVTVTPASVTPGAARRTTSCTPARPRMTTCWPGIAVTVWPGWVTVNGS